MSADGASLGAQASGPSLMSSGTCKTLPKQLHFLWSLASFHPILFGFPYLNVLTDFCIFVFFEQILADF